MSRFNKRQLALWGSLAATLAATWWASTIEEEAGGEEQAAASARAAAPVRRSVEAPPSLAALEAPRPAFAERAPAVFGVPPPPPPAAGVRNAAPPRPRAPALPYSYVGSIAEDGGERTLFLLEGERLVTARVGEVLAGRYRVEAFDGDTVTFIFLPLKETQRISLANSR